MEVLAIFYSFNLNGQVTLCTDTKTLWHMYILRHFGSYSQIMESGFHKTFMSLAVFNKDTGTWDIVTDADVIFCGYLLL